MSRENTSIFAKTVKRKMAIAEEIEKYCRNCVSRDFVNGKGLFANVNRELPDFDEECENPSRRMKNC